MNPNELPKIGESPQVGVPPPPRQITPSPPASPASPLKQIRTYQGDVAEALKSQNESIVSIRHAEQVKRQAVEKLVPALSKEQQEKIENRGRVFKLVLGTMVLSLFAGLGIWYSYQLYQDNTKAPTIVVAPNKFLSSESSINVDLQSFSRDGILSIVTGERTGEIKSGAIKQIQFKKSVGSSTPTLVTTKEFLNDIGAHAPARLVRAFDPLFMVGVLGGLSAEAGQPSSVFMLVQLISFENAFPGMLDWEANLRDDLLAFFVDQSELGNVSPDATFSDITINNKDARVLRDITGRSVLLYSFYDNNLLIITDNENTLRTLITRLTSEKLVR